MEEPDHICRGGLQDIRVNRIQLAKRARGRRPRREMLVERAALAVLGSKVGDVLVVKLPDDTQREVRIAGTAYDPAQMPAQFDGTPYAYITFETLDWMGQPYGFNELHVISTNAWDKAWAGQVVNRVKDKAERSGYTIPLSMTADPGQLPMDDVLQGILLLMGALGLMSLFLSVFLVVNTVTALLAQQRRQIGVMKAIGGASVSDHGHVPGDGHVLRRNGSACGGSTGNLGRGCVEPGTGFVLQFRPWSRGGLAAGHSVCRCSSDWRFRWWRRSPPSLRAQAKCQRGDECLFRRGGGSIGAHWIGWVISGSNLWLMRHLPIRSLLLSIRNMFRNQGRLALTLITLTWARPLSSACSACAHLLTQDGG